jgi:tRNA-modifying protein YgfZ
MKAAWRDFLIDAGAEIQDERVVSFGNPERETQVAITGEVLCDLSHWGLIGVHGDDALSFLQNQLSSDVTQVTDARSQLSSYLSPKGRMLASFRLFHRGDTYFMRLPAAMLEATLQRLRLYVLRAKLTLQDASDALVRCGYAGRHAPGELQEALGACPAEVDDCVQAGDITALRVPGPHPRFELYGNLPAMQELWTALNVRGAPVGPSPWALLDILAGIPNIWPATSDRFVPQMTNLQLLGGVSFKKGCYPGQEIVARMHYLGQLKRRMYRIHLRGGPVPQPGEEIFAEDRDAEPGGMIVDAQPHPDGGAAALAVLRIEDAEGARLHLGRPDGTPLKIHDLPYAFG